MTWILSITPWLALLPGPLAGLPHAAPAPGSPIPHIASVTANIPGPPASRPEDGLLDHGVAIEEEEDGLEKVTVAAPPSPFALGRSLSTLPRPNPSPSRTAARLGSVSSPLRC